VVAIYPPTFVQSTAKARAAPSTTFTILGPKEAQATALGAGVMEAREAQMAEERKGPVLFGMPAVQSETSAVAVARIGGFTQSDKDIALEMAVAGLVSDAWRKPPPTATTNSPVTVPGNGWRDTGPLRPPPGVNLIDAMVHAMQPHGVGNPERVGPAKPKPEDDGPKAA
jgi:hypothetical protein